jgi:chromosome segregation ATPase
MLQECAQDQLEASEQQIKASMAWQEQVIDEIKEYQTGCAKAKEEHEKHLASKIAEMETIRAELVSKAAESESLRTELQWAIKEIDWSSGKIDTLTGFLATATEQLRQQNWYSRRNTFV